MSKAEQIKRDEPDQVYQDDQTKTVRTPPGQHGQRRTDGRDQDQTIRSDLIKAETRQAKSNGVATPKIVRKANALDTAIMLLDQSSVSTANSTDKLKPNQVVREHTNNKDESKPVQCKAE